MQWRRWHTRLHTEMPMMMNCALLRCMSASSRLHPGHAA
jgi:hypothetical protein